MERVNEFNRTKMKLSIPGKGEITLDGTQEFAAIFFDEVKQEFIKQLALALRNMNMKGGFDVVETARGNQTTMEIVERAALNGNGKKEKTK